MEVHVNPEFIGQWAASEECRQLMLEVGTDVETRFRDNVPRRTGNLAHSSVVIPEHNGQWEVVVEAQIYYAMFVEFGTRYMSAQYNLRDALGAV